MKDEPRPVPVPLDQTEPPVFQPDAVDDPTILARWLQRGIEKGPLFWLLLGGATVVVLALAALASGLAAGRTADPQAWADLMTARTAEDSLKVADAHPDTPLALGAKLQAANKEFADGFDALSNSSQRDLAGPRLKKALDLYRQVADAAAAAKSPQAPIAAYGVARALEARNELPEAIKQYKYVASTYPDTTEARRSEAMVKALEDPENVAFYKELYAYKPPAAATPGGAIPPPLTPGMNPAVGLPPLDPTKSFLPDLRNVGPADIDPPPPTTTPPPATTPAPAATPAPATAPTPAAPALEPRPEPAKPEPAAPAPK